MTELTPLPGREDLLRLMSRSVPEGVRPIIEAAFAKTPEQIAEESAAFRREEHGRIAEALKQRARAQCGLAGEQWGRTFDTFTLMGTPKEQSSQVLALAAAKTFDEEWPKPLRGLVFWGPSGIGKDHLLQSIVNAILAQPGIWTIRYWYALDLAERIAREAKQYGADESRTAEVMRECRLVVIGDIHEGLGHKFPPVSGAFKAMLNQAADVGRPIICASTNWSIGDFDEHCDHAVGSRLEQVADWHDISGPDRRRSERNKGARERRTPKPRGYGQRSLDND
jgi:DNA replication protein DnaC